MRSDNGGGRLCWEKAGKLHDEPERLPLSTRPSGSNSSWWVLEWALQQEGMRLHGCRLKGPPVALLPPAFATSAGRAHPTHRPPLPSTLC